MDEDKSTRENGQQRSDNQYPVQGNKKKRADLASRENGKKPIEDYKQEIRDRMYKFYVMLLKQDKCIQKLARNNISRPQMLFNERELTGLNQMNIKSKRVVDNIFKIFQQLTSNQVNRSYVLPLLIFHAVSIALLRSSLIVHFLDVSFIYERRTTGLSERSTRFPASAARIIDRGSSTTLTIWMRNG